MFGFSWSELLVVMIVAVMVIGPKQIPDILYHLGRMTRRVQYMRFAMTQQFDDFMNQTELNKLNFEAKDNQPAPAPKNIPADFFDEADADAELDELMSKEQKPNDQHS